MIPELSKLTNCLSLYFFDILPGRDYVTFGFLLSQIRLSFVTFVRPTQSGVGTFGQRWNRVKLTDPVPDPTR